MDWIHFDHRAIITLANIVVESIIVGYLLQVPEKRKATHLLLYAFLANIAYLSTWFVNSIAIDLDVQLYFFPTQYLFAIVTASMFIRFSFAFHPEEKRAEKWWGHITNVIIMLFTVGVIYFLWEWVANGIRLTILPNIAGPTIFGLYIVASTIFLTHTVQLTRAQTPQVSITQALLRPPAGIAQATRAFGVLMIFVTLASLTVLLWNAGVISPLTYQTILAIGFMGFNLGFTQVHLSYTVERTSLFPKLLLSVLVLMLMGVSFMGLLMVVERQSVYLDTRVTEASFVKHLLLNSHNHSIADGVPNTVYYVAQFDVDSSRFEEDSYSLLFQKEGVDPLPVNKQRNTPSYDYYQPIKGADIENGRIYHRDTFGNIYHPVSFNITAHLSYFFTIDQTRYEVIYSYRHFQDEITAVTWPVLILIIVFPIIILAIFPPLITNVLTQPLNSILAGMQRVEQGSLDTPARTYAQDELGYITRVFNSMTQAIKRQQNELKEYSEDLEVKVAMRTEELESAKRELEDAYAAKSEFLANISHELRTPLNAIIGYSELIADDAQDMGEDQFSNDAHRIRHSGQVLLGMVNDILDFSKIEAGETTIKYDIYLLDDLVQSLKMVSKALVDSNENEFIIESTSAQKTIYTDGAKLRQALLNLISNSAKFTKNGRMTLKIDDISSPSSRDGRLWISFALTDTGIGIPEDRLDKIFQPFRQADTNTNELYGGTGLGLSITKRFIELLGGRITVTSTLGQGSTFCIEIPSYAPPIEE